MPIMDGIQTTESIIELIIERGYDPRNLNESPYICCVSAYSENNYVERAKRAGMHSYLTKPANSLDIKKLLIKLKLLNTPSRESLSCR